MTETPPVVCGYCKSPDVENCGDVFGGGAKFDHYECHACGRGFPMWHEGVEVAEIRVAEEEEPVAVVPTGDDLGGAATRPFVRDHLPASFSIKVVGVSFVAGYPETVFGLERQWAEAYLHDRPTTLSAQLVRDPTNEFDPNAIAVDVDGLGRIGHVPRKVSERLAPEIDAGTGWRAEVREVLVHPDNPNNPGISVWLERSA